MGGREEGGKEGGKGGYVLQGDGRKRGRERETQERKWEIGRKKRRIGEGDSMEGRKREGRNRDIYTEKKGKWEERKEGRRK